MPFFPVDYATVMQPAMRDWVVAVLAGWNVAWAAMQGPGQVEEGAPPLKPRAMLRALDMPQGQGQPADVWVNASPTQMDHRIRQRGLFTLEIQLYADTDERATVEALKKSIEREYPHREALRAAGLTPEVILAVRDLTQIFSGAREFRGVLEIQFSCELRDELQDHPWIQTIPPPSITVS